MHSNYSVFALCITATFIGCSPRTGLEGAYDRIELGMKRDKADEAVNGTVVEGKHQVRVRQLWKDYYRVNVFVGQPASAKVMHSYFMIVDGEGNVVTVEPPIINRY